MANENFKHDNNNNRMIEDDLARGKVCQQNDDDDYDRRVCHNDIVKQSGSFCLQVTLTRENLHQQRSWMAGVVHVPHLNPNALIISLQSHMQNGPQSQSVLVAMIMSINPEIVIGKT
eukprot:14473213-Ditylum_brightwellii.AAC.1